MFRGGRRALCRVPEMGGGLTSAAWDEWCRELTAN
jgi:hypothetical protein